MWKIYGAVLLISAVFAIGLILVLNEVESAIKKTTTKIESKIGKSIVLKNDTLLIIDYSLLENNYTLEDGRTISFKLSKELQLINNK